MGGAGKAKKRATDGEKRKPPRGDAGARPTKGLLTMTRNDYSTVGEAELAEYIEAVKRYQELKDRVIWSLPPMDGIVRAEVVPEEFVERVSQLTGNGIEYTQAGTDYIEASCKAYGVKFSFYRNRGRGDDRQQA